MKEGPNLCADYHRRSVLACTDHKNHCTAAGKYSDCLSPHILLSELI